ncbi:hypothetical protein [Sodalis sp. dw_96]|uniref:hypothetical protein n=1 Tax=Sodalis sp. dw_96 TaxID=2719794 RepID=UPI001BD476CB|nr:hypothetical protein [Sodalis sp. dw_96]
MTIYYSSNINQYFFSSTTRPSPERNNGMGTSFRRASNAALPRAFSWVTGIAGGAIMALPTYLSCSAISSAVNSLNQSLHHSEAQSRHVFNELICMGICYGSAGGVVTGLSTALLLNHCSKISNRSQYYDDYRDLLVGISGVIGLVVGGIVGSVYSISEHLDYADFHNHAKYHYHANGHNHANYNNKLMIDD